MLTLPHLRLRGTPRLYLRLSGSAVVARLERDGGAAVATEPCAADPLAIAEAAVRACAAIGARPGRCLVGLAGGIVEQQPVELPPLGRRDLCGVIRRRGAQLVGVEDPTAVQAAAWHLDSLAADDDGSDRGARGAISDHEWLIVAARRAETEQLFSALRRQGFRVERAVPSLLAAVSHLAKRRRAQAGASFVVVAESDSTGVALVADGAILHLSVLAEDLTTPDAKIGMRLVQELRQLGVFWRRSSTNAELVDVVTLGLGAGWIEMLEPAIHAALGSVAVVAVDDRDTPQDGLAEGPLAATARGASDVVDFRPVLAPERPRVLAIAAVLVAAAAALGFDWHREWSALARIHRDSLRQTELAAVDLPALEAASRETAEARAELEAELDRLTRLSVEGLDLERALGAILTAVAGRAELSSLRLDEVTGTLELVGTTGAGVDDAERNLLLLSSDLSAAGVVRDVECRPASSLPEAAGGDALPFTLTAKLIGGQG